MAETSSRELDSLCNWIAERCNGMPFGCLVRTRGVPVVEIYGNGFLADTVFEVGSIRKSFNSALIGIGIEQDKISLDLRASEVWPELIEISDDERDREITLHHLASGTSGWLTPDPPGAAFRYNNAAFTAAERVVARVHRFPNDEIAPQVERLFKKQLAAESWRIYHFDREFDPANIENPGPKLAVDSNLRDLVKWGEVWLRGGEWNGRALIPKSHVARATRRVNPQTPNAYYGYNWFANEKRALWPQAPADSFGHCGFGTFKPSQQESRAFLWVCPSLGTVAALIADVTAGFANDFLEIPNRLTAEWVAKVVVCVSERSLSRRGPNCDVTLAQ